MGYSLDSIYHSASWAIWNHSQAIYGLQEQAATGQKVNRTSDDPIAADRVLNLRNNTNDLSRYSEKIGNVMNTLGVADTMLQTISKDMISVGDTVVQGSTSSMPQAAANDINETLESFLTYANSEQLGKRVFGGDTDKSEPFVAIRDANGKIVRVDYVGGEDDRLVEVAPGVKMPSVLVGTKIFNNCTRQDPTFNSADENGVTTTGLIPGAGTSSARGTVWVDIVKTGANTYDLTLDGGATVSVDVTSDTNIALYNQHDEVLYVDVTNLSMPDVPGTATEAVTIPGTYDIFNSLIAARDLLEKDPLTMPNGQWDDLINEMISIVGDVEQNLTRAFPLVGGRIETLVTLKNNVENMKFNTEAEISGLTDADFTEVAIELSRRQVLYQMSLSVASKMFDMNLMDFIT